MLSSSRERRGRNDGQKKGRKGKREALEREEKKREERRHSERRDRVERGDGKQS